MHPWELFWILTSESSLSRVSDSLMGHLYALKLEKENICIDNFPDFNVKSSSIENIMKNLTDSRKTMETGLNRRLIMEDIR